MQDTNLSYDFLGRQTNSPEVLSQDKVQLGAVNFDPNLRTISLGDDKTVALFAQGSSLDFKILHSKTGAILHEVDGCNASSEDIYGLVPAFKTLDYQWYSENLDLTALGDDRFVVVWRGPHIFDYQGTKPNEASIYGRVFSSYGEPISDTFLASDLSNTNAINPNVISWDDGMGFSVGSVKRYTDIFLDHFRYDGDTDAVEFAARDSGLVHPALPSSYPTLDSVKITNSGSDFLVSLVSKDTTSSPNMYDDVVTWRIEGDIGELQPQRITWLTPDAYDPYGNRSTEVIELTTGDNVVTYWGYSKDPVTGSTNTKVSMNLNAQIVYQDGTSSEPIILGRSTSRDETISLQPFALEDGNWGVSFAGSVPNVGVGTHLQFYDQDGTSLGAHLLHSNDLIVQSSSHSDGTITLVSYGHTRSTLEAQALDLDVSSLGAFDATLHLQNGEATVELGSTSFPSSSPLIEGETIWMSGQEIIAELDSGAALKLSDELIGKTLSVKFSVRNDLNQSAELEVTSERIIEQLDTDIFLPLLSETNELNIVTVPSDPSQLNAIQHLVAYEDASLFTYHTGNYSDYEIGVVVPRLNNDEPFSGFIELPSMTNPYGIKNIVAEEAGGYSVYFESHSGVSLATFDQFFKVVGEPILVPDYTYTAPNNSTLSNGNKVSVDIVSGYDASFTIREANNPVKTFHFENPSPSYITAGQLEVITPIKGGGFIAGGHQFSAAGEYVGSVEAPIIGTGYLGSGDAVKLSLPDGTVILASATQTDVGWAYGISLTELRPELTLSGDLVENSTISVSADGLNAEHANFVWVVGDNLIPDSGEGLLLTDEHVNQSVNVYLTDAENTGILASLELSTVIQNVNDDPVGAPTLVGELIQGQTLSIETADITDEDGVGSFQYQWFANSIALLNENKQRLFLSQDLVGTEISAEISYTDSHGTDEDFTVSTGTIVSDMSHELSGEISVNGVFETYALVEVRLTDLTDLDGIEAISYQWYRDNQAIEGANEAIYRLAEADEGQGITAKATVIDSGGNIDFLETSKEIVISANPPVNFEVNLQKALVVGNEGEVHFTLETSHASFIADQGHIKLENGRLTSVESNPEGTSHTFSVVADYSLKPVTLTVESGAIADAIFGISNSTAVEGLGFVPQAIKLPENIFDVGPHYDLFDKVEHNGDSYYYLSYAENSSLYRWFSSVSQSYEKGTYSLTLPTKAELHELFTNSDLDGTNSGNYISRDDVWWGQDYWYSESESGQYDSSMWLAQGYMDMKRDGQINFDKADAHTAYKVDAETGVQLFQLGPDKFINESGSEFAIIRHGSNQGRITVEIEVTGLDTPFDNLQFKDSDIEIENSTMLITLEDGVDVRSISFSAVDLADNTQIAFNLVDSSTDSFDETAAHRSNYVATGNTVLMESFENAISGEPQIIGNLLEGETLEVDVSSLDTIAEGKVSFTFNWLKNGILVGSESSYTLSASDIGANIDVNIAMSTSMGEQSWHLNPNALISPKPLEDIAIYQDNLFEIDFGSFFQTNSENPLSFSASGLPASYTIDSATGLISGTSTNDDVGEHEVTVTGSDLENESVSSTFTLSVANVNDAPSVSEISDDVEDQGAYHEIDAASYFTDIDYDIPNATEALSFSASGLPSSYTIDSATGLISGTSTNDDVGEHEVTVTGSDLENESVSSTFTLSVANINDAPSVSEISDDVEDQGAYHEIDAASYFTDIDYDIPNATEALSFSASGLPSSYTIDSATGLISGTSTNDDVGEHEVTVTGSDLENESVSSTFTLSVANINDAPSVSEISDDVEDQGAYHEIDAASYFTDIDYDIPNAIEALSFSASGLPASYTIDSATGLISGTSTNDDVGEHEVTVTGSDLENESVSSTFTLSVANINDAPSVSEISDDVEDQGAYHEIDAASYFTDIDYDIPNATEALSFSASGLPASYTIDSATGLISGTSTNDDVGEHEVTVTGSDLENESVSSTFTLSVANVNDAPSVSEISDDVEDQGAYHEIDAASYFTDIDYDIPNATEALSFSASGLPASYTIDSATGLISGTSTNDDVGEHEVTVTGSDLENESVSSTFTLSVANINDAPSVSEISDDVEDQGAYHEIDAASYFTDIDYDIPNATEALSFSASGLPASYTIDSATGLISGTSTNDDVGEHEVTVTGSDLENESVSSTFTLSVANINDAPSVSEISDDVEDQGAYHEIDAASYFTDIDYDIPNAIEALSFSASGLPASYTIDSATGLISGTSTNDDVGEHEVTVTGSDLENESVSSTFTLSVANINDAPSVSEISDDVEDQGAYHEIDAASYFTDIDYDIPNAIEALSFSASGLPASYTIDSATGLISGTSTNDDVGEHEVTVTGSDLENESVSSTFTLSVANVNDAPTFTVAPLFEVKRNPTEIDVSTFFDDIDLLVNPDEALSFFAEDLPEGFSLNSQTGLLNIETIYESSNVLGNIGAHQITIEAQDLAGLTVEGTLDFDIIGYELVSGGSGDDWLIGGLEDDLIATNGGDDFVYGLAGDDRIEISGVGDVVVDTGEGADEIVIAENAQGSIEVITSGTDNTLLWNGSTEGGISVNADGDLLIGDESFGLSGVIREQMVLDAQLNKYVISDSGFKAVIFSDTEEDLVPDAGVFGSDHQLGDYLTSVGHNGDNFIIAGGGADTIVLLGGDDQSARTFVGGDILNYGSEDDDQTQNISYGDELRFAWAHEDVEITDRLDGFYEVEYVGVGDDAGKVVQFTDIEKLVFEGGANAPVEIQVIDGPVVGSEEWFADGNDWGGAAAGQEVSHGDNNVEFQIAGDTIKVYADISETITWTETETRTVKESYKDSRGRTKTRNVQKTFEVEKSEDVTHEGELIWQGSHNDISGFSFSDDEYVNVISVREFDIGGNAIEMTLGTEDTDLIFGTESDNVIFGAGGDDLIVGGGGNDTILGGSGEDAILGGMGDDLLLGDWDVDVLQDEFGLSEEEIAALLANQLNDGSNDDLVIGGDGIDEVDGGEGRNVVISGGTDLDINQDGDANIQDIEDLIGKDLFDDEHWV